LAGGGINLGVAMVMSHSRKSWLLVALGSIFLVIFATVPVLRNRAVSILDRSHHSNLEREHMWHAGIQLWKTHPLLGIGPGNVKQVSVGFQTPEERIWGPWDTFTVFMSIFWLNADYWVSFCF
jgi:O-antigen ligase